MVWADYVVKLVLQDIGEINKQIDVIIIKLNVQIVLMLMKQNVYVLRIQIVQKEHLLIHLLKDAKLHVQMVILRMII